MATPNQFVIALGNLRGRLAKMPAKIKQILDIELVRVGNQAARRAAQLTPRSGRGNRVPIADRWKVKLKKTKRGTVVRVFNSHPRANRVITLKGGGETSLLEILEKGSRPHEIVPVKGTFLRFTLPNGQVIYTKRVCHPGTPPHNMIAIASVEAAVNTKRALDVVRSFIRRSIAGVGTAS